MKKIVMQDVRKTNYHYDEAIKTLQTNIQFVGKDIKTIIISSCFPNEGKSDIAFSLAKEMAASGKRVLLLDADIRKSVYTSRFRVEEKIWGLSQFLSGQVNVSDLIYTSNYENLDIIFAGPPAPNPTALLGNEFFVTFLQKLYSYYDYIFIDTPPIANIIDAAVVAEHCDGAILVIENEAVSYRIAQKAVSQLQKSGCRILGAVLNKVDTKTDKYYSRYYGKKYQSYYK